uniref:Uncharacterized protein n=1 Tax=Setaria italica TaxID=4555 RepID=K3XP82_SETIT
MVLELELLVSCQAQPIEKALPTSTKNNTQVLDFLRVKSSDLGRSDPKPRYLGT